MILRGWYIHDALYLGMLRNLALIALTRMNNVIVQEFWLYSFSPFALDLVPVKYLAYAATFRTPAYSRSFEQRSIGILLSSIHAFCQQLQVNVTVFEFCGIFPEVIKWPFIVEKVRAVLNYPCYCHENYISCTCFIKYRTRNLPLIRSCRYLLAVIVVWILQ